MSMVRDVANEALTISNLRISDVGGRFEIWYIFYLRLDRPMSHASERLK